jgi:small ligand-binding sensory domain FIST
MVMLPQALQLGAELSPNILPDLGFTMLLSALAIGCTCTSVFTVSLLVNPIGVGATGSAAIGALITSCTGCGATLFTKLFNLPWFTAKWLRCVSVGGICTNSSIPEIFET